MDTILQMVKQKRLHGQKADWQITQNITCEKTSRSAQTVYKDLDGNEIKVNDGNTYVQICPINAKVTIEGAEETVTEDVD